MDIHALKPFQRIETRNGNLYIVVNNHKFYSEQPYVAIGKTHWTLIDFDGTHCGEDYQVCAVYDPPSSNAALLDVECLGARVWHHEEYFMLEIEKRKATLRKKILDAQRELDSYI